MERGAVLMPGVERARQERAISDLKVKFFAERQRNPNVDVFEFLDKNFKKTKARPQQLPTAKCFRKSRALLTKLESH
jgi:hypothetical protein